MGLLPYSCREVVFTCSNGWRLERLPWFDTLAESINMDNCVGTHLDEAFRDEFLSLRRPSGKPHLTVRWDPETGRVYYAVGHSNSWPKRRYVELLNEYLESIGQPPFPVPEEGSPVLSGLPPDYPFAAVLAAGASSQLGGGAEEPQPRRRRAGGWVRRMLCKR